MAISDRIAVMEQGSVVQEGSAQDLYYRPGTEFVARFIGRTNILAGIVVSATEIEVEGSRLPVAAGRAVGAAVRIVARPEMIELCETPAVGAFDGRIVTRTFLGEKTDYLVSVGSTTLQVSITDHHRRRPFDVGQPVGMRFHADTIHVLA